MAAGISLILSSICGLACAAETQAPSSAGSLFQVLFGLVVVLALMAAAAWMLKRFGMAKNNIGTSVKIVGGISVGSRERILVVEVADQWIVVGVTPGRISTLSNMPKQELPATQLQAPGAIPDAKNFPSWLKQTIERRNGPQA
ncbi:N/A [soil metagenome]